ncbi:Kinase-like protein [Mycena venus]|uniref:Kinase-like protein n=1 Tax=Mycena venus TaxID=2733690 RepID=A0A8H7CR21_9AGAR|nr:Kinase-like protein [Mycena venus]
MAQPVKPSNLDSLVAHKSRFFVYQSVFSLVAQISHTCDSKIHNDLAGQYERMSAENSILAIVKSLDSRKALLQATTALGIYDDPKLRDALQEDEERIARSILAILGSDSECAAVLRLEGDSAQNFLDVVQNTLDRGVLAQEHTSKAHRMILKLSESCDKLPTSLFVAGVTERNEHATFGGEMQGNDGFDRYVPLLSRILLEMKRSPDLPFLPVHSISVDGEWNYS